MIVMIKQLQRDFFSKNNLMNLYYERATKCKFKFELPNKSGLYIFVLTNKYNEDLEHNFKGVLKKISRLRSILIFKMV